MSPLDSVGFFVFLTTQSLLHYVYEWGEIKVPQNALDTLIKNKSTGIQENELLHYFSVLQILVLGILRKHWILFCQRTASFIGLGTSKKTDVFSHYSAMANKITMHVFAAADRLHNIQLDFLTLTFSKAEGFFNDTKMIFLLRYNNRTESKIVLS